MKKECADKSEISELWVTLRVHENDTSMNESYAWFVYSIPYCYEPYRFFRVIQTGKNAFSSYGGEDNWGNVLVASGFDLFGLYFYIGKTL